MTMYAGSTRRSRLFRRSTTAGVSSSTGGHLAQLTAARPGAAICQVRRGGVAQKRCDRSGGGGGSAEEMRQVPGSMNSTAARPGAAICQVRRGGGGG